MKVRKRPVEVEAFKWDGSAESASVIINWALSCGATINYVCDALTEEGLCPEGEEQHHLVIRTLEGDMIARAGYWIIKGVKGEFYGCEPEIFAETYESSAPIRSAEERLTDLIQDIKRTHKEMDGGDLFTECVEDIENWPCDTIKAVRRAEA